MSLMKLPIRMLVVGLTIIAAVAIARAAVAHADPFTVAVETPTINVAPGAGFEATIAIRAPEGFFIYDESLDIDFDALEGMRIRDIDIPQPVSMKDPMTGRERKVFPGGVTATVKGMVPSSMSPGERELVALVSFQGCSKTQCYRPRHEQMRIALHVVSPETLLRQTEGAPVQVNENSGAWGLSKLMAVRDFDTLLDQGILWVVLVVFLAGLLSSLTPCLWPIIPVILVISGAGRQRTVARNLMLALSMVAGIVLVYAIMGVVSAAAGRNLGFLFQQRWFILIVVLFFVVMSLGVFGLFHLHLPSSWSARFAHLAGAGFRGAFMSGLGVGLIASPCTGPVIAALAAYVAIQGSYARGFVLFIVYGMGMGVVIALIGAAGAEIAHKIRGGVWMIWVRRMLAMLLLVPAIFYARPLLNHHGVAGEGDTPRVEWIDGFERGLGLASAERRPIMMEVYADWCPPCRILERRVFCRADIARLSYLLIPVRVDATHESRKVREILDRFGIMAMPTILFLSPDGLPYDDLRVTVPDRAMIEQSMRAAIERAGGASDSVSPGTVGDETGDACEEVP